MKIDRDNFATAMFFVNRKTGDVEGFNISWYSVGTRFVTIAPISGDKTHIYPFNEWKAYILTPFDVEIRELKPTGDKHA